MDFGYQISICWNRRKGQKNFQLHGAKPLRYAHLFVASIAISMYQQEFGKKKE
jgi:hypothetical protein